MPFSRRTFLRGVAASGLIMPALVRSGMARGVSNTPKSLASDFGVVGDGVFDDSRPMMKALNSGAVIDGQGKTYALSRQLKVGGQFKGLVNAKLRQTDDGGENSRVIEIRDADSFVIENVSIMRGGDGSGVSDKAQISRRGGVFIYRSTGFVIRGLDISGGGIGSGLASFDCNDFKIDDLVAHDIRYRLQDSPGDDSINGILLVRGQDFGMKNVRIRDLGGTIAGQKTGDYNRGLGVTGCKSFTITDIAVQRVGQAIDFTGSAGNQGFTIENGLTEDCVTWGFKLVHTTRDGKVLKSTARRCGISGFLAKAENHPDAMKTQSILFDGCLSEDVMGTYGSGMSFGFGINKSSVPGYPRNIVFQNCIARTTGVGRMHVGFKNDIPAEDTDGQPNRIVGCTATGFTDAAEVGF